MSFLLRKNHTVLLIFPALSRQPISLLCLTKLFGKCLCSFSPISPLPFSLKLTHWLLSGEDAMVKDCVAKSGGQFSALMSLNCLIQSSTPSSLIHFLPLAFWALNWFSLHSAGLLPSHSPLLVLFPRPLKARPLVFGLVSFPSCYFQFHGFKYHQTLPNLYLHSTPFSRLTNPTSSWTFPLGHTIKSLKFHRSSSELLIASCPKSVPSAS